jgi:N-methylhydantoinase B
MPIDRVTLQILADHCRATTESMAQTLFRTAHSTFVKETEDFTTGLATPGGKTFASPYDLGATWFVGLDYARAFKLVESYEEGDICMTNDPYSGFVCTHSPDVHLWKPIFHEGKLVCFAVGHIHNTDVGGAVPASLSRANVEVHQEGIRVPPVKLYRRGELNREVLEIMLLNVRMREQNWGDLKAEIAAMHTGERRVHEMVRRFGADTFREGIEDLLDYAEQQARNIISKIPDGEYFFADYMDEDSVGGYPARIAVNLTVRKDELVLDFSDSDPQVTSSLNLPTGGDPRHVLLMIPVAYVLYTMDPTLLLNCGVLRAASCILPEGSIVNPKYPAAVGMRTLTCIRLQSAVFGAFAQALPDLVPAACGDGGPLLNVRTFDTRTGRRLMANLDPITGGGGAISSRDGTDGSGANFGFLKNTPVEINEAEVPVKILGYGLARDSGGAGRYRGGAGSSLEFQVTAPDTVVTARNRDRSRFTPWGSRGGGAGKPSSFLLNPGTERERNLGNTDVVTVRPGDVVRISSAGAGGWGDPREREPERVLQDVRRGFVSIEAARDEYGVAIRDGAVVEEETRTLRTGMTPTGTGFGFNPARVEFERVWTREVYRTLIALLSGLPVEWRFFVKHRVFEELSPGADGRGTPEAVERQFHEIVGRFPQLHAASRSASSASA